MDMMKLPCYCATLRRATRLVTAVYDEHLRATGVRATQFTILGALHLRPGMRITDMVDMLAIDQTTLTRTLALLRKDGLVTVASQPSGREKCWRLSGEGEKLIRTARPLWEQAQEEVHRRYGKERIEAVNSALYELSRALVV